MYNIKWDLIALFFKIDNNFRDMKKVKIAKLGLLAIVPYNNVTINVTLRVQLFPSSQYIHCISNFILLACHTQL